MAAPENVTTLDFNGKFVQNRKLSDDTDKILALQGVGWLPRKIVKTATITLFVKHYKDDEGAEHIDIKQTITGGISGAPENRTLDWTPTKLDHSLFGAVVARARRIPVAEVIDEYLSSGWLPEVSRDGAIQSYAEADEEKNPHHWKSDVVWGFEDIKGERRYTRKIKFTGPEDEVVTARLVYDYAGPVA